MPRARSSSYRIPDELKGFDTWVLWDGDEKVPLAPWETGDMYRAGWGRDAVADPDSRMENRPETDFETVKSVAELPIKDLHHSYPFPKDDTGEPNLPDELLPTILLPHDPPDPPIMQVDFDDVRDSETGEITQEVFDLVDQFDAYTEVSSSGNGLHVFVRAELPGSLGKFIADLEEGGGIELYDHGRFVGCTWAHVDGTPMEVPERQEVIDAIVKKYETDELADRRKSEKQPNPPSVSEQLHSLRSGGSNHNPYYDIDVRKVADVGDFRHYRTDAPGPEWQGPHPDHGPKDSAKRECTNFEVDPPDNVWYCFVHNTGGGPLSLLAVVEGIVSCSNVGRVHDDPEKLAKVCLVAREQYPKLEGQEPPYDALVGVGRHADLNFEGEHRRKLTSDSRRLAEHVFAELEPGEL